MDTKNDKPTPERDGWAAASALSASSGSAHPSPYVLGIRKCANNPEAPFTEGHRKFLLNLADRIEEWGQDRKRLDFLLRNAGAFRPTTRQDVDRLIEAQEPIVERAHFSSQNIED